MRVTIMIDEQKCTRCGFCVDACPVPCLVYDEAAQKIIVENEHLCLVCRNCEDESPHNSCVTVEFPYRATSSN